MLAVVSPPRIQRFRELLGLTAGEQVTADFAGWSKLVLLTADLAVLFPRDHTQVEPLRWEVEALQAVAAAGLPEVPEVVAVWEDEGISPYPVVALRRLRGTILEKVLPLLDVDVIGRVVEQVGRLAARWHNVDPGPLAGRPTRSLPHRAGADEILGTRPGGPAADELAARIRLRLGLDADAERRSQAAIDRARALEAVLVHSDVHEGQILVDPEADFAVSGVLDWQTARVDHPFTDFDLGEWGPTIWRRHRASFPELRRRYWNAYAGARGLDDDLEPIFEWVWAVSHAMWLADDEEREYGPEVTGSLEEAVGRVRDATRSLSP
jgi:aminoglycoside phosphotransferase (APT) family kinase protein